MTAPLEMPSVLKARDGRLMMIGAAQVAFSQDGARRDQAGSALRAVKFAIRLASGKLGGPGPNDYFFTRMTTARRGNKRGRWAGSVPDSLTMPAQAPVLIQTRSGGCSCRSDSPGSGHQGLYDAAALGDLNGKLRPSRATPTIRNPTIRLCSIRTTRAKTGPAARAAS